MNSLPTGMQSLMKGNSEETKYFPFHSDSANVEILKVVLDPASTVLDSLINPFFISSDLSQNIFFLG